MVEILLQPKVRVVPLEGVPATDGQPDVAFMRGPMMDPLVQTNPFLVIFSSLERITDRVGVPPGMLVEAPGDDIVFVWQAFGRPMPWRLNRSTLRMDPIQTGGSIRRMMIHLCPMLATMASPRRPMSIRRSPESGAVEIQG